MDLEKNLIDNILESEIKLGYAAIPVTFYYPLTSITELLECDIPGINEAIDKFRKSEANRLGNVIIQEQEREPGRFEVTVPVQGVKWVHDNFEPSPFMIQFISNIKTVGFTLEDVTKLFTSFSEDVEIIKNSDEEWAISFADESIDPYVYYIEQNAFGLEYHRFTRASYEAISESYHKR